MSSEPIPQPSESAPQPAPRTSQELDKPPPKNNNALVSSNLESKNAQRSPSNPTNLTPSNRKPANKHGKPKREYLGWEDAAVVEWKAQKEAEGYKNWEEKWGTGQPFMKRYNKWICSGIGRGVMRKPSWRSLEWLLYDQKAETPQGGECRTRIREKGVKGYIKEPIENYNCCPCPWPCTTSREVGWLAHHECCKLEIYPNDFMKTPSLPWYMPPISAYLSNSQ